MSNLKYWLWLSERKGMPLMVRQRVVERFGTPEAAYFADDGAYRMIERLSEEGRRSLNDKSMDGVDKILEDCERLGLHIMTMQDAIYPERLRVIHQPPLVLYWRGREIALDEQVVVAMVGTRDSTRYGEYMAGTLAQELTRSGAVVASGIAKGIDGAALAGAIGVGGPVISVLGNGHDIIYPVIHRQLYEDVARCGMLLSEYPPGTRPLGANFPVRNRILSGLSLGVVVVESPIRGGSLITANHALEQDREVFAVPGRVTDVQSAGANKLIQDCAAKPIARAEDILCEFRARFPNRLREAPPDWSRRGGRSQRRKASNDERGPAPSPETRPPRLPEEPPGAPPPQPEPEAAERQPPVPVCIDWSVCQEKLTDDQRDILLALREGELVADELVERTGLPARRVLAGLTILQVEGMVAELSGKRFQARVNYETSDETENGAK